MELHITPALALLREHHLLDYVSNLTDFTATSVSYDSRKVKSGTLFFCIRFVKEIFCLNT